MSLKLNDIASDLFVMNKYTVDKLFASTNPADCFALYGFYYKTAKWQETNQIKANDTYVKMCLKWGVERIRKAKVELKKMGLIQIIQRRKEGKVEGWYIQISYLVSNAKSKIIAEEKESNNTQKQQVEKATSSNQDTSALKQNTKCLKIIEEDKTSKSESKLKPIDIINYYKENISTRNEKIKEKKAINAMFMRKESFDLILTGLKNYKILIDFEKTEEQYKKNLFVFIDEDIYLDHQEEPVLKASTRKINNNPNGTNTDTFDLSQIAYGNDGDKF